MTDLILIWTKLLNCNNRLQIDFSTFQWLIYLSNQLEFINQHVCRYIPLNSFVLKSSSNIYFQISNLAIFASATFLLLYFQVIFQSFVQFKAYLLTWITNEKSYFIVNKLFNKKPVPWQKINYSFYSFFLSWWFDSFSD